MKLIPYMISYIKDAAKAVDRICLKDFTKTTDDVLTELLGLAPLIVKMYLMRCEGDHDVLHLWCTHRHDMALCTRCGSVSEKIHEESHRCIRHLDIWNKRTFLHFLSRRFKCESCGCAFTEELPFIDSHRRQSNDFERYICQECLSSSRKAIADREGLSQSTVKDIFSYYASMKHRSAVSRIPLVLGIDELSLKKRHKQFVLVISDIDRKCIPAILQDREKKTLEKWIEALKPREKKSIRYVSIDMWAPYCQAARSQLPHAKIVVDRFHVMKQLNSRLTQLRTKYQKESPPDMMKLIKGSRWILVRNRAELTTEQEKHLVRILEYCPDLREIYLLKEEFRNIFEKIRCREKAERFFDIWILKAKRTGNKYLLKFVATLMNWRDEILNYFIERITNGFVEGLNNGLRTLIRGAYGYRNFENFRLQAFSKFSNFPVNPR